MTRTPTAEIVRTAAKAGRGVGSFNVVQLEHAEAVVTGAEAAGAPVILQISENTVAYHGGLAALGAATMSVAGAADIPVAVHLDHATSDGLCRDAVDLGFSSVMFDASVLPYAENVTATAEVVRWCHDREVWVEAELGEVGGKDGVHAPNVRTDPGEAASYVAATGVDLLAVAVGTSHAMLTPEATVDLGLVAALHDAVPVPLVLHGSSGVPADDLDRAVASGMTKINIATHLNKALTRTVRERLDADPTLVDPRRYLGPARTAVAEEVTALLRLLRAVP